MVQGAYLVVELPPEVEVADVAGLSKGCRDQGDTLAGFSNTYISCSYISSTRTIIIKNGFLFESSTLPPNGRLTLNWQVS